MLGLPPLGSTDMGEPDQTRLKRISHYTNKQRILLVGEGDFSFSSSLATAFGAAHNMVATSLDSSCELQHKYGMYALSNTSNLSGCGAQVFHGFDARIMATHNGNLLCGVLHDHQRPSLFDRIIFNFPHAGFRGHKDVPEVLEKHRELVQLFFANASRMLSPGGEVHVSHKLGAQYDEWRLQEQAQMGGLRLVCCAPFNSAAFPGYQHRRGDGKKAGKPFHLGRAATYIFAASNNKQLCASVFNIEIKMECEPLRTLKKSGFLLQIANLLSLKEKLVEKSQACEETPLLQVVADEVTRLKKLNLGKKLRKLKSLESMLEEMIQLALQHYSSSLLLPMEHDITCMKSLPPSNCQYGDGCLQPLVVGLGGAHPDVPQTANLVSLKKKLVKKGQACQETSLLQVVANEVTRLKKLKLGKKKMKKLESLELAFQLETTLVVQKITFSLLQPLNYQFVKPLALRDEAGSHVHAEDAINAQMTNGMDAVVNAVQTHVSPDFEWCSQSKFNCGISRVLCNSGFLLQVSNLMSVKEKLVEKGRACEETPLLRVVADEVARLKNLKKLKFGKKKLTKLKSLESTLKEMKLVVEHNTSSLLLPLDHATYMLTTRSKELPAACHTLSQNPKLVSLKVEDSSQVATMKMNLNTTTHVKSSCSEQKEILLKAPLAETFEEGFDVLAPKIVEPYTMTEKIIAMLSDLWFGR